MVSLSFTPTTVDTSTQSQTVTAEMRITDNLSGVSYCQIIFGSPLGQQSVYAEMSSISGDTLDGIYEGQIIFPKFSENGTWNISSVYLSDSIGNYKHLSASDLTTMGLPTTLTVTGTQDVTPPSLVSLSFTPTTVDTGTQSQTVTAKMRITDNLSGFAYCSIYFYSPSGQKYVYAEMSSISGNTLDGIYEGQIIFPKFSENGTWNIYSVYLSDSLGNYKQLSASDLTTLGLPTTLTVTGTQDVTPPSLVSLSLTPTTVDTGTQSQTVTAKMRITDNLSGVSSYCWIQFYSPSKQQYVYANMSSISGDTLDGIYEGSMSFPQFSEIGTWNIYVGLSDSIGNYKELSASDLTTMGLPATFTVYDSTTFVTRDLPDFYMPGTKLTVTLKAAPASDIISYLVADSPPAGWKVENINENGFFDATMNKVKFGPFDDNLPRTFTYDVTPSEAEIDKVSFSGTASADGVNSTIHGESQISSWLNHQADNNPVDFMLSDNEVTAYVAAWKRGTVWSTPPNPIPDNYVSNAGYLWRTGQKYEYVSSAGEPPYCWIDEAAASQRSGDLKTVDSSAVCDMPADYYPGTPFTVTITITPPSDVTAYTVSDTTPKGWVVSSISDSGAFDSVNNKVKFGLLYSSSTKTLTYQITPPATATGAYTFAGTASFDSKTIDITGVRIINKISVAKPIVTTGVASSIASTTAKLAGTVKANGASTTCYFEYGLTTDYGKTTAVQSAGSGTTTSFAAYANLTGLTAATTYHFRLVATNSGGTTNGADKTFTTTTGTVSKPTATTGAASLITANSAKLTGTVNPKSGETTYYFEFGATTAYGEKTEILSVGSGTLSVAVSSDLLGLNAGITYHFRLVAKNSADTTYGADKTFTTPSALKPVVTTELATLVTATTAKLNGTVNPNGLVTSYYFQYGTTTSYGSTTRSPRSGSDRASFSVNKSITGLAKATIYHFRIVAINSAGTTYGLDKTFTTLP